MREHLILTLLDIVLSLFYELLEEGYRIDYDSVPIRRVSGY
jgi:hypothetical protein